MLIKIQFTLEALDMSAQHRCTDREKIEQILSMKEAVASLPFCMKSRDHLVEPLCPSGHSNLAEWSVPFYQFFKRVDLRFVVLGGEPSEGIGSVLMALSQ